MSLSLGTLEAKVKVDTKELDKAKVTLNEFEKDIEKKPYVLDVKAELDGIDKAEKKLNELRKLEEKANKFVTNIEIDASDCDNAIDAMHKLEKEAANLDMDVELTGIEEVKNDLGETIKYIGRFEQKEDEAAQHTQRDTQKMSSAWQTFKGTLGALGLDKIISKTFSVISNHIGDAVSRLDQLNNFPKVMSNLGISAKDSEKSVSKLSKGLENVPTRLDDATASVQRFTSKNNDINKSTDYFLALNDALLAGGQSSEIQASALEQLSQSYAKGKMDMMEWRSLQQAMPAQLNQVAKAMGMTSDELGEGLRSGEVSMDDFMKKIVELDKKGANGFKSFREQALNSVDGLGTQ